MICRYCQSTFTPAYGHPGVMDEGTCAACRRILVETMSIYPVAHHAMYGTRIRPDECLCWKSGDLIPCVSCHRNLQQVWNERWDIPHPNSTECRRILTTVDQLYALDPPVVWDDEWEYRVLTPACRAEDVDGGVVVGLRYLWPVGRSERATDV